MPSVVDSVRLEYRADPPFVAVAEPRISWVTASDVPGWRQLAAELRWDDGAAAVVHRVAGDASVLVAWPFPALMPRQRGSLSVRVEGVDGWTPWSRPREVVASFLADGEWQARFIGLPAPKRHAQPGLLRREFSVGPGLLRATWYATAHGVYSAEVNGKPVDDQLLKPGWTPYQYRLIHETADVTGLLIEGANAIGVALAGGWFTEAYGFQGLAKPFYGNQPSFAGQLLLEYADGRAEWLLTGPGWQVTGDGPWIASGIYVGETYDARKWPDGWSEPGYGGGWEAAAVLPSGPVPGPRTSPEARVTQQVPVVDTLTSPSGRQLLDFGQNLVGRLRIRIQGPAGATVTLRHAEVLEDGELGVRPLRLADATDRYTLAGDGVEEWAPSFTFHGFRYAEVTGWPGDLDPRAVTAEVIGSDMPRTGWFECSDPLVNRLHENVVWGMRGNFLYLPTDCPQRDERLGWAGDIQVFSPTASYLYDCNGFLASWLVDLALEQRHAGGVPFIVPDVLNSAKVPAAAWGDVATVLPWVLYQRYGDADVLAVQYESSKAWVDQVLAIAGERYLWEGGFQFGDWVDPDSPPDLPGKAKADSDLVASAYLYRSTSLLAQIAALIGQAEDAAVYAARAEKVRQAWLAEYVTPAGRILSDAQTSYALAIEFGIAADPGLRRRMGERLAWLVRRDGYRISTGFVGTPLVTDALTHTGHPRQAGRMLQQTECPSWLYPVTMGATTIWERWDSLLPDGSINPGEMTSFNHYALGAVADWLHRTVAGLAPASPGYKHLEIAPQPLPGLDWATTRHDSPYGTAEVEWRRADGRLVITATVPPNSTATVRLPGGESYEVAAGRHEWTVADPPEPAPAMLTTSTSLAEIMDDPEAYRTVVAAFNRIDPQVARDFTRRMAWVPNQPLFGAFSLISPAVIEAVEDGLAELNSTRRMS
jgi:alpha-L-rhamnosidase